MSNNQAGIKPGPSDYFKRGLDFAANWHEAEASHAKAVRSEMDRYSDDHEERSDWRSWKDKEDRHLYCAAVIRKLPRPSDTPPAPQAVEAVSVDEVALVLGNHIRASHRLPPLASITESTSDWHIERGQARAILSRFDVRRR